MKRLILFVIFSLLLNLQVRAQNRSGKITYSFDDLPLLEVLKGIEERSPYRFYFAEEWFGQTRVSGHYTSATITQVLEDLLESTLFNFHLMEGNRIILTRNNIIYDDLPTGFFGSRPESIAKEEITENEVRNPVFLKTEENPKKAVETVRIGKETGEKRGRLYILEGVALNKATGEPISNLAVLVSNSNKGTVTDQNGYYNLRLPAGSHLIETKSLGNEDLQVRVLLFNNGNLDFNLAEDYEQLGEIYLESNQDKNVKDAFAGTEEVNVEDIKNIPLVLGERDIMKVAATLPGISTAGEGSAGFNVRGGKTDQNLILLDDAVIYNPAHFFGIFSALNPFTTGEVKIYKGNMPAEYGGRLSSVFDIKTKDPNTEKLAAEASVGPLTGNLSVEVPVVKDKSGLIVGGRSTYSDWILKSLEEESLKNSTASFYDLVAKYQHKISPGTEIKATGYYSRDKFSITSDSLYNYNNRLFSLRLNHNFNEKNRGSLIATNSDYEFGIDYNSENNENFTSGYNINESEVKLNMKYIMNPAHTFDYGISSKLYQVHPGSMEPQGNSTIEPVSIPMERGLESAAFIADSYKVNEKLLIYGGLRFSIFSALGEGTQKTYEEGQPRRESTVVDTLHFDPYEVIKTYGGPEVRLSARYFILPDLSTKLSYNNTLQYIHTLSNNTTVSPTDTYKLSDLNVEPQRASQYSLGLFKNFDSNTYEVSLEGYYKTSRNILDYKVGAQLFLNQNIETEILQGEGKSFGAEFSLKKTTGKLNGWLAYSYSRSYLKLDGEFREEQVNNGRYFPANFDKPHDLSLVANYKITRRFSFSGNFVYQTGRPVTYPTGKFSQGGAEYVNYSDRNKFRIPDYFRLDLSFNVEGNHKLKKLAHSFWNISIYNVLGRNNPYSVFFVTKDGDIKAYKSSIFSIPVPTITYNLKF